MSGENHASAVERLYQLAIAERSSRLHDWDVSDTKAGVLIAFSGVLVATVSSAQDDPSVIAQVCYVGSLIFAGAALVFALVAFWPKVVPTLEFDELRRAMAAAHPDQELHDQLIVLGERHREAKEILNEKAKARERSILLIVACLASVVLGNISAAVVNSVCH